MFSAVLGLFSQDLAVDLGTSNTRVRVRHTRDTADEPTVVTVHTDRAGRRTVTAVGREARPMLGRTPEDLQTIQPIRGGRVVDFEVAEALLVHLVRRAHGRSAWMRPRMIVAMPHRATDMEIRAVRDSCESAGAREVKLVPRPIAAALGADLPIHEPSGVLVVDVGGGATEISILSLNGVVASTVVEGGGEGMDVSVVRLLEEERSLFVGRPSAERLKIELGTACDPDPDRVATIRGRCRLGGIPRAEQVSAADVHRALVPHVEAIADAVRRMVDAAPPEIGADIVDQGVVLTGGGARLRNLDRALRERTGLPVVGADRPEHAVIQGVSRILADPALYHAVA